MQLAFSAHVIPYMHCVGLKSVMLMWKSYDLDHVLLEGGKLYKSLNKNILLSAEELPHAITLFKREINMSFLELQTGQASSVCDQFLGSYILVDNQYGFLLFINGLQQQLCHLLRTRFCLTHTAIIIGG